MRTHHHVNTEAEGFNWHIIKYVLPYVFEYKKRVFLALAFMILAKLASVGLPFILKFIVDDLDTANNNAAALIAAPIALVIAYGFVRFSNVLFGEIRDTLFGRVTERAIRRIGLRVFKHLHLLDLEFHLNRRTGGLSRDIERGTTGINFLMRFMVFNIIPTLLEIGLVIFILFFNYGINFAAITLLAIVAYVGYSIKTTEWRTNFVRMANKADSASNSQAIDSLINYETTKYFTNEDYEAQRYDTELADWEIAKRKNRLSLFVLNGGQAFIIAASMTAMMVLAAMQVANGSMTLGDFVLINAFMMQIFIPLNFLGFVYREMKGSLANIELMFNLLAIAPKVVEKEDASNLMVSQGKVEFNNVSFHYHQDRAILKNVNFDIKPGEKLAIVGASGGGKSTLVKLLFRFYDVNSGAITIDGQNINDLTFKSLRRAIGIVPQDTVLFNDNILENVRYGKQGASDDEVLHAIKLAHLDEFIQSLPDGVNTMVGERGLKLSGGEKQRVAIARTILKKPPILVFDEATSSLDSKSEQAIMTALKELSQGVTSMVIAHRLSTIVDADKIIVMDSGVIAEMGNHDELIAKAGIYAKLWAIQQQNNNDSK
ncbi:ABCB family ABC transporter ATP-binding protein/permease [Thalassotalea sp. ND16A]|uniref:ABCB family ABC transporter ATP-binding protein/permease n=1 Tax=Thalassotalea sp. ND16A TaxID=1535422 RepID=UPI00051A6796|nr:ABC transporter ATP-binding protein/permease [Thalassotalea sp. ND16A]KGJ99331.1 Xenobiotic-transporting ATPase [Thalassotalea sp. ND16A]